MAILESQLAFSAVVVALTCLIAYIYAKLTRRKSHQLPGPPSYPFLGCALEFFGAGNEDVRPTFQKWIDKYGLRFALDMGPAHYVGLNDPEGTEKLLSSSVHISKGDVYRLFGVWLGEGLLTSKGKKWQTRRKLLTPAFHFKILDDFMKVFNEQSKVMVQTLKNDFNPNEVGNIFPYITRCALDIICETAMGVSLHAQTDRESQYVKAIYSLCEMLQYRFLRPWLLFDFIWKRTKTGIKNDADLQTILQFTKSIIAERKKERLSQEAAAKKDALVNKDEDDVYFKGKKRLAFLDMLLDAQANSANELSDSDIREEVDTFMFEGHDTTAASIGWTVFLLANHPEHQEKVREELEEIFGDDKERSITSEDLTKMKYLELCIKESLRLYPSVPFVARELNTDFQLDADTVITKGSNVFVLQFFAHRNPAIFPDPERFDPSRFTPENSVGRHPYAYIPFSAGPRNCIGQKFALMEEKVVLANIFRNFRIEAAIKMEEVVVMLEIITRPRDGFPVKVFPL